MQKRSRIFLLSAILLSSVMGFREIPETLEERPVLDHDFPDPAVLRTSSGWYYAYATQSITEDDSMTLVNVQVAKSRDLQTWEYLGDALPEKPDWADETQFFWAPDVVFDQGTYYLYFSALHNSKNGFCIGVATSPDPAGPFRDSGEPVVCGQGFTNIDPMAYDDPVTGEKLLYWGSGFDSIRVQALSDDRLSLKPGSEKIDLIDPVASDDPDDYRRLLEGAWVVKRDDYYYLFYSGDNCCSPPHYAVLVARSKNATGPFEHPTENWRDSIVVEANEKFLGPGHNSVIEDENGKSWIVYHAIDVNKQDMVHEIPGDRTVRRVLMVKELEWKDGWPKLAP